MRRPPIVSARASRADVSRAASGLLVLVVLLTVPAASPGVAAGANLTGAISATRRSQLYYESSMRYYDAALSRARHGRAAARRHVRTAERRLRGVRAARSEAREWVAGIRIRLEEARMEAEAEVFETFTTGAWLRDPGLEVAPALETELLSAWADQALAERPSDAGARTPDVTGSDRDEASADVEGQAEDESVASLERKLARAERRLHHLVRKDRRLERRTRAAVRHVQAYRRMAASAASRRSGSEGALWWSIRSMTRLAQARAAKKTGVRPGRDGSGFSWPAFGRISQGYGCTGFRLEPRVGGCAHFHDGIDIAAGYGTSVRASAPGVVAYVGWNPQDRGRRAFMVVIGHPGGFETVYGHLLAIRRVRVGQFVARGQSIGYVGNTGRSTGAHLHWEVSRGFSTLNPLAF